MFLHSRLESPFFQYNSIRGQLHGANLLTVYQESSVSELLATTGWSENDMAMFNSWFFPNESVFSGTKLHRYYQAFKGFRAEYIRSAHNLFFQIMNVTGLILEAYWLFLLCLLIISGLLTWYVKDLRNKIVFLILPINIISTAVLMGVIKRFPSRIAEPFFLSLVVALGLLLISLICSKCNSRRLVTLLVVVLMVSYLQAVALINDFSLANKKLSRTKATIDYISKNYPGSCVMPIGLAGGLNYRGALKFLNNFTVIPQGWATFSPQFYRKLASCGVTKGRDFLDVWVDSTSHFVLSKPAHMIRLQRYSEEHYLKKFVPIPVWELEGGRSFLYRLVSPSDNLPRLVSDIVVEKSETIFLPISHATINNGYLVSSELIVNGLLKNSSVRDFGKSVLLAVDREVVGETFSFIDSMKRQRVLAQLGGRQFKVGSHLFLYIHSGKSNEKTYREINIRDSLCVTHEKDQKSYLKCLDGGEYKIADVANGEILDSSSLSNNFVDVKFGTDVNFKKFAIFSGAVNLGIYTVGSYRDSIFIVDDVEPFSLEKGTDHRYYYSLKIPFEITSFLPSGELKIYGIKDSNAWSVENDNRVLFDKINQKTLPKFTYGSVESKSAVIGSNSVVIGGKRYKIDSSKSGGWIDECENYKKYLFVRGWVDFKSAANIPQIAIFAGEELRSLIVPKFNRVDVARYFNREELSFAGFMVTVTKGDLLPIMGNTPQIYALDGKKAFPLSFSSEDRCVVMH